MLAALVVVTVGCTSGGEQREADRPQPTAAPGTAFPSGSEPFVVPTQAPPGSIVRLLDRGVGTSRAVRPAPVAVFGGDPAGISGPVVLASISSNDDLDGLQDVDVGRDDGRRVSRHAYIDGLFVDFDQSRVHVLSHDATDDQVQAVARVVTVGADGMVGAATPADGLVLLGTFRGADLAAEEATVEVRFGPPGTDPRAPVLSVFLTSVGRAEQAAARAMLVRDPVKEFAVHGSIVPQWYPSGPRRWQVAGRTAWYGVVNPFTQVVIVEGDPGLAFSTSVTYGGRVDEEIEVNLRLLERLAPRLERVGADELERRAALVRDGEIDRQRTRMLRGRPSAWEERTAGEARLVLVDATPRFAGPDTAATRNRPAPCLAVIVARPEVVAYDGCLGVEPVMSVGEAGDSVSGGANHHEAWGLVDDRVDRVELRLGSTVLATARLELLDRPLDGRRRLFLLPYTDAVASLDPAVHTSLTIVALDRAGSVLRTVAANYLGTFHAMPGAATAPTVQSSSRMRSSYDSRRTTTRALPSATKTTAGRGTLL